VLVIVILLQALSYAAIGNTGLKMPIHELIEVPLSPFLLRAFSARIIT